MDSKFTQEQRYLKAKKKVKEIKGVYIHLIVYILVNLFLSGIIIFGLMQSGKTLKEALTHFATYATILFWGIGLFFHWMGVFGVQSLRFAKNWEERKIKELMRKEDDFKNRLK